MVFIEDLGARLELAGNVDVDRLVTGMAVGVVGEKNGPIFEVSELIHPGVPPQIQRPIRPHSPKYYLSLTRKKKTIKVLAVWG